MAIKSVLMLLLVPLDILLLLFVNGGIITLLRCMGRRGQHKWPARNPDLTPYDFFYSLGLVEGASLIYKTNNFVRT